MKLVRCTTLLVTLALAWPVLPAAPTFADDEAAAAASADPLGPTTEMSDKDGIVKIDLPNTWTVNREVNGPVIAFNGPLGAGEAAPGGFSYAQIWDSSMRAPFVMADLARRGGQVVDGSKSSGKGWAQQCIREDKAADWYRAVEHQGKVVLFVVRTPAEAYAQTEAYARAMLDKMSVAGDLDWGKAPDGWESKEKRDILYTHEPDANEGAVDQAIAMFQATREALEGELKDDPFDTRVPEIRMYQSGAKYDEDCTPYLGTGPDYGTYVPQERAVFVKLMSHGAQGFDERIAASSARQFVHQYFGGDLPYWIQTGLVTYGQMGGLNGGDGEDVSRSWAESVIPKIQASRPLNEWFTTERKNVTDEQGASRELWGWVYFFFHGRAPGKARKAFENYLDALRETGDPDQALDAWKKIDHRKLHDDFKKWAEKLG